MFKTFKNTAVCVLLAAIMLTGCSDTDIYGNETVDEYKYFYRLGNSPISLVTGRTRNDGWYPTWIGMTMKIVRLKSGESAGFRYIKDNEGHDYSGSMHTSHVTDYYISDDKKNIIIQTENTIYKFEKAEED